MSAGDLVSSLPSGKGVTYYSAFVFVFNCMTFAFVLLVIFQFACVYCFIIVVFFLLYFSCPMRLQVENKYTIIYIANERMPGVGNVN